MKAASATDALTPSDSVSGRDRLWSACFHRSPEAQIICGSSGNIVDANQAARKWFELVPAEAITKSIGITDPRFLAYFADATGERFPINIHSAYVRSKSGATLTLDVSIHPLEDEHFLVCARDVGERERMHSHMRRIMAALECTPDSVFMMDAEFRINFVNPAFHRITGYTIEEALGQTADFFRCIDEADRMAECRAALEAGRDWSGEMINIHADGHRYPVAVTAAPVHERNGNLVGYASFERDITENRKIQEQLFQSQKMETVGTLAAGVAHDFNNLLQAITGNTQLVLAKENLSGEAREKLRQVFEAAGRAADITRQLLSFSRASDDTAEVIDISQLIEDAGKLVRHKLERAIDIQVKPSDLPLLVQMNPTRAHQAVMNLCVNALDAMGSSGCLRLETSVCALNDSQSRKAGVASGTAFAHCEVADTGGGIPRELMRKIFDPFFTTKPPGKGTGLGLAIVHRAVSEAKGILEVDTRPGDGTTFHLYLPLAVGNATEAEDTDAQEITTGSGRILLVDDEEYVLDFAQHCLEAAGYEIIPASGPDEAWNLLEQMDSPPDLLFTDYNMGKVSGLQLIARVAENFPGVKFVLASGYLEEAERVLIEQYGATILQKPFELGEATEAVADQLA